jgi:hypothetical protein
LRKPFVPGDDIVKTVRPPFIVTLVGMAVAGACAPGRLAVSEFDQPQRVMVVTIGREQAPPLVVRPGISLGVMLGSLGSGVSGGIHVGAERDAAQKPAVDFGAWDFRRELQRLFLSSAPSGRGMDLGGRR